MYFFPLGFLSCYLYKKIPKICFKGDWTDFMMWVEVSSWVGWRMIQMDSWVQTLRFPLSLPGSSGASPKLVGGQGEDVTQGEEHHCPENYSSDFVLKKPVWGRFLREQAFIALPNVMVLAETSSSVTNVLGTKAVFLEGLAFLLHPPWLCIVIMCWEKVDGVSFIWTWGSRPPRVRVGRKAKEDVRVTAVNTSKMVNHWWTRCFSAAGDANK